MLLLYTPKRDVRQGATLDYVYQLTVVEDDFWTHE